MALGKLASRILDEMALANKGEATRKELLYQKGQILIVDVEKFRAILRRALPRVGDDQQDKIWNAWRTWLLTQQSNVKGERLEQLLREKAAIPLKGGEQAFIIGAYNTVRKEKSGAPSSVLGRIVRQYRPKTTDEEAGRLSGKDNDYGAQLGHSVDGAGVPTAGIKVLKAERAFERYKGSLSKADAAKITAVFARVKNTLGVNISYSEVIDPRTGKLKIDYTPVLSWQGAIENWQQGRIEGAAINELEEELKKLGGTISPNIGAVVLGTVAPKSTKSTKVTTTGKTKKKSQKKQKASKRKQVSSRKKINVIRDSGGLSKLSGPSNTTQSYVSLLGILNEKLPQTVLKNMGPPGLVSRTGRFAASVRALDVNSTAQGFPSIGYTYDQNPYRVFEPGSGQPPWASSDRDPRKVIDKSIREIAAGMAIGRFYTRRV